MTSEPVPTGAQRFFDIAEALCRAVGNAIRPGFIEAVLAMLVVRRIQRVRWALLVLEGRFLAGRLRRRTAVARLVVPGEVAVVRPAAGRKAGARFPLGFGWLCPLVPSYAAGYANHMRILLAEPGMQDLLAACPQAVRAVGPLCRMLGIERAVYVPAGVLAAAAVALAERRAARVVVPRKARAVFDWAREDAHYAMTQVPRRFRLRVG